MSLRLNIKLMAASSNIWFPSYFHFRFGCNCRTLYATYIFQDDRAKRSFWGISNMPSQPVGKIYVPWKIQVVCHPQRNITSHLPRTRENTHGRMSRLRTRRVSRRQMTIQHTLQTDRQTDNALIMCSCCRRCLQICLVGLIYRKTPIRRVDCSRTCERQEQRPADVIQINGLRFAVERRIECFWVTV